MVVYIDILICLNIFVNYFILLITTRLNGGNIRIFRQILAAVVGALFSLYIFIPKQGPVVELLVKLVFSAVIIVCGYGFGGWKKFFRLLATFYGVSFLYAGLMLAMWFTFRPNGMAINNGVVYFNISPLMLIGATVISYLIILLIGKFRKRPAVCGTRCQLEIAFGAKTVSVTALVDTGHSLTDLFSDAPVVITEYKTAAALLPMTVQPAFAAVGAAPPKELGDRYRVIPYSVIGGNGLLPAFRCDTVTITEGERRKTVKNAVIAVSSQPLGGDYGAIVSPEILYDMVKAKRG